MGEGCCKGASPPIVTDGNLPAVIETRDNCCGATSETGSIAMSEPECCCCSTSENCDEDCILIAASLADRPTKDKSGATPRGSNDFSQALEKYKSLLETAKCICRSVLEEKGVSCCTQKALFAQPSKTKRASLKPASSGVATSGTVKQERTEACSSKKDGKHPCCAPDEDESWAHLDNVGQKGDCCTVVDKTPRDGCCTSKPLEKKAGCCDSKPVKPKGGCCRSGELAIAPAPLPGMAASTNRTRVADLEKSDGHENVALSVQGMTCNDCAEKLHRTLTAIPGIHHVRVNFIRGQADFNIESSLVGVDDVLTKARDATGFAISRLKQGTGESLNLLISGPAVRGLAEADIEGVTDITVLNKTTVQVDYEPTVIGGRDLLERIGPLTSGLAPPGADPVVSGGRRRFQRLLILTILSTVLTIPVVTLAWGEDLTSEHTRGIVSFVLASFVQLLAVPVFYKPALRALIVYHALELDMLVVVSITAAYLYSIVAFAFRLAGKPLETAEFFETSTLLITLVMLGRLLASYARIRAVAAVSMRSLQSTTALLVERDTNTDREIDSRLLQYGDIFKVLPHCRIPTDGIVIEGASDADESMLTGEGLPVHKQPGSNVIAGTVNGAGILTVGLTRLPGKNTVMDIAHLVEDATNSRPRVQDLADRVASYFLPVVSGVSLSVFIIWLAVGVAVRGQSAAEAVPIAITYAIAVLAVSCPCALGLAVPMVLVVGGGIAARGGVILKSAECTERSRKVTDVVFDKTGTLTQPDLDVLDEDLFGNPRDEIAPTVKALVSDSKHPVSLAVSKYLEASGTAKNVSDVQSIPGAGVQGWVDGTLTRAGTPQWTGNADHARVQEFLKNGLTLLLVTRDSTPVALFGLRTRIRPEAARVVSTLRRRGITVHLVSGDQRRAVEAIASSVGIDSVNVVAQSTPSQKQKYVADLMELGKYVLFCGDGTNDAVAVAQANIGAQVSDSITSSDVTGGAADVILLSGLNGIPFLLDVSKAAFRRIVFNFTWSATYNVLGILLAAGAFVRIRIEPAYAGAGELVSVLPVVAAAMSMLLLKLEP